MANYYDTMEEEEEGEGIVNAIGNIPSLSTCLEADETGGIETIVNEFISCNNRERRMALIEELLYEMTGVGEIPEGSRGSFDAGKLHVIEQAMGEDFIGADGANPNQAAVPLLEETYGSICSLYYELLANATYRKPYLDLLVMYQDGNGKQVIDTSVFDVLMAGLEEEGGQGTGDTVVEMSEAIRFLTSGDKENLFRFFSRYADNREIISALAEQNPEILLGTDAGESMTGDDRADFIVSGTGNDTVNGSGGDDVIFAGEGNDAVNGGTGDDTLVGGEGDDILRGDTGSDIYVFRRGDGEDIIRETGYASSGEDMLLFTDGITEEEVSFRRNGNDLVIRYGEDDSVTVQNCYATNGLQMIEKVMFSDGTEMDLTDIGNAANRLNGTDGDDVINGYNERDGYNSGETIHAGAGNDTVNAGDGDDILYGEEGDDILNGGTGDDTLIGGEGDDILRGDGGSDTYIFHSGDGNDVIQETGYASAGTDVLRFGSGIRPEDITIRRENDSLIIRYGDGDEVTISRCYWYADSGRIERIEFEDLAWGSIDYDNLTLDLTYITQEEDMEGTQSGMNIPEGMNEIRRMADLAIQEMSGIPDEAAPEMMRMEMGSVQAPEQLWTMKGR